MCAKNLGEILTPEELADRLKVSVSWIYEKRRPRCANPIPALPMGRLMRFDWETVVEWLKGLAVADANSLQQRRTGRTSIHRAPRRKKTVVT
jgi:excisionase family DNA binding protein